MKNVDWAPSIACTKCINQLQIWGKGNVECMPFGILMMWSDAGNHDPTNCYVCVNNVRGINRSKASKFQYKSVLSAQTPLPHSENVPIPKKRSPGEESAAPKFDCVPESSFSNYQPSTITPPCRHIEISQNRLEIMVRQLKLSQNRQKKLAQHLKEVNILAPGVKITDAVGRQREFLNFFDRNENNTFAYCNNIRGLMLAMGNHPYDSEEWRLFIDSSKSSLKAFIH